MAGQKEAPLLDAQDVTKAFGAKPLFDGVNLTIAPGARIGLIGDNGCGKSTFLGVLDGSIEPDGGKVLRRGSTTVERLAQAPHFGELTIHDALASALAPQRDALAAYEAGSTGPDAAALQAEVERVDGWAWTHHVERAGQELDLGNLQRRCSTLSGGFNKRVALARLMLGGADILLLDEPTNHLDLETIRWLENWLQTAPHAVLVVTHDRTFLDETAHAMAELQDGRLTHYQGNYSDYLVARAERESLDARREHRAARHLRHELEWAAKSPQARTTKNRARLDRVEAAAARLDGGPAQPRLDTLQMGRAPRLGNEVLVLDAVTLAPHPPRRVPLFAPLTLRLCARERWGIVGPNGVGKTSLLKLVEGSLTPLAGRLTRGKNTQVAYFDQHRTALDGRLSVTQILLPDGGDQVFVDGKAVHVGRYLERFGFGNDVRNRRVAELSGGEKNRLALAKFLLTPANLLLLDEPTNDLDLTTLAVLERALVEFTGCMLLVSHDRAFLDRVTTGTLGILPVAPGATDAATAGPTAEVPAEVTVVQGNYAYYMDHVAERAQKAQQQARDAKAAARAQVPKGQAKPVRKVKLSHAERQELGQMEAKIEAIEAQIGEQEARLGDAAVWQAGGEEGRALQQELDANKVRVAQMYSRWEWLMGKEAQ